MGLRRVRSKKLLPETIMDKIFETNSSFHVKQRTTEKIQFLFSRSFLLVLSKISFWEEDWALGYNSLKFWQSFLTLNLMSFGNSWANLYLPIISPLYFTCGERKICWCIKKSMKKVYDQDCTCVIKSGCVRVQIENPRK